MESRRGHRHQCGYDPEIAIAQLQEAHRRAVPETNFAKRQQELRAAYDPSTAILIEQDLNTHEQLWRGVYPPIAALVAHMEIELNQVGEQERSHAPQQGE